MITINDGANCDRASALGRCGRRVSDATATLWPSEANPPADDNVVVFVDVESDGDPDFLIGSLDGADRLLVNDGTGHLTMDWPCSQGDRPSGTLGMAIADLDGDARPDVVQAQGEAEDPDAVSPGCRRPARYRGTRGAPRRDPSGSIFARVTDQGSGMTALREVTVEGPKGARPLTWYGESLWWAEVTGTGPFTVCATDRAGNRGCSGPVDAGT